jgi:hypothetical protein
MNVAGFAENSDQFGGNGSKATGSWPTSEIINEPGNVAIGCVVMRARPELDHRAVTDLEFGLFHRVATKSE